MKLPTLLHGENKKLHLAPNTRLVHWLAEVLLAGFAPAFTLLFHYSECSLRQLTDKCP